MPARRIAALSRQWLPDRLGSVEVPTLRLILGAQHHAIDPSLAFGARRNRWFGPRLADNRALVRDCFAREQSALLLTRVDIRGSRVIRR